HRDFQRLSIFAPLLVLLLVWGLLGRKPAALLALLPMVFGVVAALALAALTGIPIGTFTLIVVPLLFGLGVDYGVYMSHRYLDRGTLHAPAALASVGRTLIVISSTTFIAFASLCLADFRGLREIGLLTACGIATSVVTALIVLPAALSLLDRSAVGRGHAGA
ncbi:MAG: MMPL family transporter, partial [Acidobacteriota bacterium]